MGKVYTFEEFKKCKIEDDDVLNIIFNNVIKLSKLFRAKTAELEDEGKYVVDNDLLKSLTNLSVLTLEEDTFSSYKLNGAMFGRLQNIKKFEDMLNEYVATSLKAIRESLNFQLVLDLSDKMDRVKVEEFESYFKKLQNDICRNIEYVACMRETLPEGVQRIYYPMEFLTLVFMVIGINTTISDPIPKWYKPIFDELVVKYEVYKSIKSKYLKAL